MCLEKVRKYFYTQRRQLLICLAVCNCRCSSILHKIVHVCLPFRNSSTVAKQCQTFLLCAVVFMRSFYFAGTACISYKYLRKALLTRRSELKRKRLRVAPANRIRLLSQKNRRARARLVSLTASLNHMRAQCASIKEALEKCISRLPPKQQASVRQCFEASRRASRKGMHYNQEWILECILMKMKSRRLYQHIGSMKY